MIVNGSADRIPLADGIAHCAVTSPPYWSLRKYAGEQERDWPGIGYAPMSGLPEIEIPAWRGALGLEPTPEMHVAHIVAVFREVWRVLRDDGVAWVNYGDCFAGSGGPGGDYNPGGIKDGQPKWDKKRAERIGAGNLYMIPHRVALALQADGWIIRNDVVWAKNNPMPESCAGWRWERERIEAERVNGAGKQPTNAGSLTAQDGGKDKVTWEYGDDYELRRGSWRHTRAHEFVFMCVKSMGYWSDQEAVREAAATEGDARHLRIDSYKADGGPREDNGSRASPGSATHGRNPRSVLTIPSESYKGAHYATYPTRLISPLIRASCPRWACPVCGAGWSPVVERTNMVIERSGRSNGTGNRRDTSGTMLEPPTSNVLGYRPTCDHPHEKADAVPGIVFDPFLGSGTTGAVAQELQRRWVGLDISGEYLVDQAKMRTGYGAQDRPLDDLPLFGGLE